MTGLHIEHLYDKQIAKWLDKVKKTVSRQTPETWQYSASIATQSSDQYMHQSR